MPKVAIDGIATHYAVTGSGPPLLLYSPGGFDATLDKWWSLGVYARVRPLEALQRRFTCIAFDRRETGRSGGRVERVTWSHYVRQGKGLLDHLGFEKAHLMGGCMGCSAAAAFAVAHPEAVLSQILFWPTGGPRFRLTAHARFAQHLALVEQAGMAGVVAHVRGTGASFSRDPRVGPWAPVIRSDPDFAAAYAAMDVGRYRRIVAGTVRTLVDRDTAPGPEPEDLMQLDVPTLIVPGRDAFHGTSAARYLEECIHGAEYWDAAPEQQTAATLAPLLLDFLERAGAPESLAQTADCDPGPSRGRVLHDCRSAAMRHRG